MTLTYGSAPELQGTFTPDFHEYLHYMYLPIIIPDDSDGADGSYSRPKSLLHLDIALPKRLEFARPMIEHAITEERMRGNEWDHVYLTARRGFATPGNPLNRPGWHSDGFGTEDINYVWTDRYPTLFAVQKFENITDDHIDSIAAFEEQIDPASVITYGDRILMRLDPYVIHAAPEIPAPGGERSFLKVSFANSRYNLLGNSHNHLLDYDWKMHTREAVRNDPARTNADRG